MTTELASTGCCFTLVVAALLCVSSASVNAQGQNVVVISGVTVMSGTGRPPIKNAVIVIEGNRIKQVGAKNRIKAPRNARVFDAAGKYVIPGLADMHIHPGARRASFLRFHECSACAEDNQ